MSMAALSGLCGEARRISTLHVLHRAPRFAQLRVESLRRIVNSQARRFGAPEAWNFDHAFMRVSCTRRRRRARCCR